MKTKLLFLALFLFGLMSYSQNTYVPDDNFEQALIDLGYDIGPLDDYVQTDNINTVTDLAIWNRNIDDLIGIEDFSALTTLNCAVNNLTNLDVSNNSQLTYLNCEGNLINSLNVSNLTSLSTLFCNSNNLTTINLNELIALTNLYCSNNQLTTIDVSQNSLLELLNCYHNELTNLYINQNQELIELTCSNNQLSSLDVSLNTKLEQLSCSYNQLTSLDVSNNPLLEYLWCDNNFITSIDVSQNSVLIHLVCSNNQITNIDVSQNTQLGWLICSNNQITNLDVSMCPGLWNIGCESNQLQSLNVKNGNNDFVNEDWHFSFNALNNPELTCVNVDDAAFSTANWTNIDSQTVFSEDCSAMSVDDFSLSGFKMYPNPASELLTISLNNDANYSLMNLNGQVFKKGKITHKENTIDVSNLSSGIFFLKVKTDEGVATKKLIKQ